MGRDGDIRIGTADRERALDALAAHLTEGRLELTEYDNRCRTAAGARTRAELLDLFEDLPSPHPSFDPPAEPPVGEPPAVVRDSPLITDHAPKRSSAVLGGFLAFALTAVVVVTAITGAWWALVPAVIIGLFLLLLS